MKGPSSVRAISNATLAVFDLKPILEAHLAVGDVCLAQAIDTALKSRISEVLVAWNKAEDSGQKLATNGERTVPIYSREFCPRS